MAFVPNVRPILWVSVYYRILYTVYCQNTYKIALTLGAKAIRQRETFAWSPTSTAISNHENPIWTRAEVGRRVLYSLQSSFQLTLKYIKVIKVILAFPHYNMRRTKWLRKYFYELCGHFLKPNRDQLQKIATSRLPVRIEFIHKQANL